VVGRGGQVPGPAARIGRRPAIIGAELSQLSTSGPRHRIERTSAHRSCHRVGQLREDRAAFPTEGQLSLFIRDQRVGEATIKTQSGKFGLGGGGLVVRRSGAEPVTSDYAGARPWAFVGGSIKRVMIDISGGAFVDLVTEARAAFARQ
jgi:hypothetical protein